MTKSIYQASLDVLKQYPEGLHYKRLTNIIIEDGLITTSGKTPRLSVNSIIHRHIKRKGVGAKIKNLKNKVGYFIIDN